MSRSLVETLPFRPPKDLIPFLENPPLVGNETSEQYYSVFAAIVMAVKPKDAVHWLHVRSVVDLTWEHKREAAAKTAVIAMMQKEVILELLKATHDDPTSLEANVYRIFKVGDEAGQWAINAAARKKIDAGLAAKGYSAQEVLARAYMRGAKQIDAIDKRIASYEVRRMMALREIERRDEKLARRLKETTSEIIDAEFSETAA